MMVQGAAASADWCYVNNVQDRSRPTCLSLPAGQGCAVKREMTARSLAAHRHRTIQRASQT
jgi:hypothetical protein